MQSKYTTVASKRIHLYPTDTHPGRKLFGTASLDVDVTIVGFRIPESHALSTLQVYCERRGRTPLELCVDSLPRSNGKARHVRGDVRLEAGRTISVIADAGSMVHSLDIELMYAASVSESA